MKKFSVVVLVALFVILVIGTDSRTVSAYNDDSDDFNTQNENTYDIFRYTRSIGKYTKISTKHPIYVFLKKLFKFIAKIFSIENPINAIPDYYQNNT